MYDRNYKKKFDFQVIFPGNHLPCRSMQLLFTIDPLNQIYLKMDFQFNHNPKVIKVLFKM